MWALIWSFGYRPIGDRPTELLQRRPIDGWLPPIDLTADHGRAYGFKGRTVENPSELSAALEAAVNEPGPYLLNVKVTQFENVYPMVPAGGAINEMVMGPPVAVAS